MAVVVRAVKPFATKRPLGQILLAYVAPWPNSKRNVYALTQGEQPYYFQDTEAALGAIASLNLPVQHGFHFTLVTT